MVNRADNNQNKIVDYLRQTGRSVVILSQVGGGCPDLLVGDRGINYLFEVKSKKGKLSKSQKKFALYWNGMYPCVVRSVEDVQAFLGNVE
jgi:Holliday junction resolvase